MPPSGPMDALAFRLANALVGNGDDAAGLEFAITGPTLRFHSPTTVRHPNWITPTLSFPG